MRTAWLLTALAALSLAACADKPKGSPIAEAPAEAAPEPEPQTPADLARNGIELLMEGRADEGRAALEKALAEDPSNRVAKRMLQQLDQEPRALLPGRPEAYTVAQGETLSMLAGRFFGDSLLFYALARYNGIEAPDAVRPGQVLQIPRPPRPAQAAAARSKPASTPQAPASAPAPARDPARAAQLRAQGLDQLNRGAPAKAVALLRQALTLDPGNAAIQRDLERAQRIQASLAAR